MRPSFHLAFAVVGIGGWFAAPAGAAINDPRDLPGNVLWLDGGDVDGDFSAGGGFLDGTTWVDKSPAGTADAIQSTASQRPTIVADGLNGRSVVRLDGADDVMDIDSAAFGMLSNVAGATLFGVVSANQVSTSRGGQRVLMISTGDNSAATRAGLNLFDNFGTSIAGSGDFGLAGRRLDGDSFQRIEGGEVTPGEFNQFAGVFDYSAGALSLFANGELETAAINFQTAGSTSATDSLNIRIGADASTTSLRGLFGGEIAELIVYDRALSDSERQMVESYLDAKWFQAPLTGDFNGDGRVDAADYTVWRDGFGSTFSITDYEAWRSNFGAGAPAAASAAPEPLTLWLGALAAALPLNGRRRR